MENIIEVKNLRKTYKSRGRTTEAVRGISFSVKKGEIFGILGVNGAGKSTTLNIMIGLLSPTAGSIKIMGENFFHHESELKDKMNIATAYADLANNLTVYRNLKIYALMYNTPNHKKKIADLLDLFGISHLAHKWFGDLSAGEKTRVNLCKSLINDPEILLLDEPTASLDPSIAAHVRSTILDLQKSRKMTVVFTSHNMPEVEQMCNRVALLHKGSIYRIDSPKNLVAHHDAPDLEEVFIRLAKGEFEE
ncbi:MAG: hypothetical protein A2751_04180 [Candidatus Doudnabacteria bacterium RIFCSPHIGHO2_01_FULL_46_14]|uniref:ABC transporter domain-containing protein n=1 Tax=Candidatus Doudnabacteria bacterium RIFCSPHIGHO2_01_FULL_46_14 TaxID=1817824 RepID=A0A1F5NLQ5_9BACT|nr:MAG: hypothetical protein A2751_04180 [Candidatus Doudnabacteria bacterium RIFCSPHIGHO2_01_FULL_46_14]